MGADAGKARTRELELSFTDYPWRVRLHANGCPTISDEVCRVLRQAAQAAGGCCGGIWPAIRAGQARLPAARCHPAHSSASASACQHLRRCCCPCWLLLRVQRRGCWGQGTGGRLPRWVLTRCLQLRCRPCPARHRPAAPCRLQRWETQARRHARQQPPRALRGRWHRRCRCRLVWGRPVRAVLRRARVGGPTPPRRRCHPPAWRSARARGSADGATRGGAPRPPGPPPAARHLLLPCAPPCRQILSRAAAWGAAQTAAAAAASHGQPGRAGSGRGRAPCGIGSTSSVTRGQVGSHKGAVAGVGEKPSRSPRAQGGEQALPTAGPGHSPGRRCKGRAAAAALFAHLSSQRSANLRARMRSSCRE